MLLDKAERVRLLSQEVLSNFRGSKSDEQVVRRYLSAVESYLAGNILHSKTCVRYHGAGLPGPLTRGIVVMDPERTILRHLKEGELQELGGMWASAHGAPPPWAGRPGGS
jgi:hypothetical protein